MFKIYTNDKNFKWILKENDGSCAGDTKLILCIQGPTDMNYSQKNDYENNGLAVFFDESGNVIFNTMSEAWDSDLIQAIGAISEMLSSGVGIQNILDTFAAQDESGDWVVNLGGI